MMNSFGRRIVYRDLIGLSFVRKLQSNTTNATSNLSSEITVPLKKERGPTDILRALEKTLKRDITAPRYKYHDDPFLIPSSVGSKRIFALSQESGRKTAVWIREQHADLFQHRVADPIIESFLPKAVYEKKEDVNENILRDTILGGHVTDSLTIYKLLDEQTTIETKQSLLELLCYYNNEQTLSPDFLDENWFRKDETSLKWKTCSDTEKLFAFLKQQDINIATDAYNAMICATSKYLEVDRAWVLFEEAESKNIPLHLTTYNYLITTISIKKDSAEAQQNCLIDMLRKIKESGLQPNIHTLNSALKVVSSINKTQAAREICRSLFNEFKHVGIKPSLASYHYALRTFYRSGEQKTSLLSEILDEIEGREFNICDQEDTYFFLSAMQIAGNILDDPLIGDRIHRLLLTGKNYDFLNNAYKEDAYYRNFFLLQLRNRSIDEFVKNYYDLIVPNVYSPKYNVMDAILDAVAANDPKISTPLLPRFWSHIVQLNLLENEFIVAKSLNLMRTQCRPTADSPINEMFGNAAWTLWEFVMFVQARRIQSVSWKGSVLGDVAVLLFRAGEFEKGAHIISHFYNAQNSIVEIPQTAQIEELLETCILRGFSGAAVDLVHYCSDCSIGGVPIMVQKVWQNLPLNEWQENRLKSLVGPDVLKVLTDESR